MKRFCIAPIALIFTLILLVGCGASQPKVYHVGLLSGTKSFDGAFDSFKARMTELGYQEGVNITYDYQLGDSGPEKMQEIISQFKANKVDLIVSTSGGGAIEVKKGTAGSTLPVVSIMMVNPIQLGIMKDLQHPGENVTGVQTQAILYLSKVGELTHEIAPQIKRLWAPYDPNYPSAVLVQAVQEGMTKVGIELLLFPVSNAAEITTEIKRLEAQPELGFDGVILMYDLVVRLPESEEAMLKFAKAHQLPVIGNGERGVRQGALFSYFVNAPQNGILGAELADKIFKGEKPGNLPVLTDEALFTLNYKSAQELGLTVPDYLLEQASEVIR